ncbi:AraC family transcriptional regulator [Alteromonadaceae bacterium BrNp21-10]|nr:AraC family transcriptional regulator [Alteromonadaceae bacterium BrNp21-10]
MDVFNKVFDFYQQHDLSQPSGLFDLLNDSFYFAKDREGRFVYANRLLHEHYDLDDPADVIGKTDYDFFRFDIADQIHQDDLKVMNEGLMINNKLELVQDRHGNVHWFITSKTALKDKQGNVIGVEGFSRDAHRTQSSFEPYNVFKDCINFLQQNYMNSISIEELAKLSCMSLSTFERRFKKQFAITPNQYVKRLRIHKACELLIAGYSIQHVTMACGFCDQSYFTREFRVAMGMTPRKYQLHSMDN